MRTIIFLVNSGDFSGAEKVNLEIIKNFQNKYKFYWASAMGAIDEYLDENQVEHIVVDKISVKTVRQIEHDYQPDIFHATDYNASVMCALANLKTPFISHLHNNTPWLKKIHPFVFAYLYAAIKTKKILIVSDSIEREYIFSKVIKGKIQNVANPISCQDILDKSDQNNKKQYDICFVGRLTDQKNPFLFLHIIKRLKKQYADLKAIMVGEGELRNDIQKRIESDGLSEWITLVGFQKNPYEYMGKSKILLLPSKYEGYGLVAFEALTLGLPCVVADVGGLSSIVTAECGFLCRKEEEYLEGIKILLSDQSVYEDYSLKARKHAREIENVEIYMKNIENVYESIITD